VLRVFKFCILHPVSDIFHFPVKKMPRNTILGKVITYSSIGIQVGLTVAIAIIAGVYLDQWLGTGPWLTILGLLVGVISGFTRLFQVGEKLNRRS
jgi:ATP synthase protein I